MEPNDLTPPDPIDIRLEAELRGSAPAELPNDGFSTRVLASLPRSPGTRPWWRRRNTFVAAGACAGFAVVLLAAGPGVAIPNLGAPLATGTAALFGLLAEPGAIFVIAAAAIGWSLTTGDEAIG